MKKRARKASEQAKTAKAPPRRRRFRLFSRGRNRRLKRATLRGGEHGKEQGGAEERKGAAPLTQRLKAALWATARVMLTLVALGGMGAGAFFGYRTLRETRAFDLETIEVVGARHVLPVEIEDRVAPWRGHSLLKLESRAVIGVVEAHPWVRSARVVRVLPQTLRVIVTEQHASAVVLLDALYLVNEKGELFKRATPAEADGLPVITGPTRAEFLAKRERAEARIRLGLKALEDYRAQIRPALSEVHVGDRDEITFFLRNSGTALRFGRMLSRGRLRQLDAVWAALGPKSKRARAFYLDHEVRANRVIVRMNDDRE